MKNILIIILCCFVAMPCIQAQDDEDAFKIREIYDQVLTDGKCYDWLEYMCKTVGPRLSGSPGAAASVEFGKQTFEEMGFDTVWLQPCMVPHWERGKPASARIINSSILGTKDLKVIALGGSGNSGSIGVSGEVIEVQSIDEVKELGARARGKVIFFNRPMDPKQIRTFAAYGGAVDQRVHGPREAAALGAVGAIVRSMTTRIDDVPHSGVTYFKDGIEPIPAVAVSTNDANLLSDLLKSEKIRVNVQTDCKWLEDKLSYNVVGEIRGSTHPNEIILVGGHLDSWDVAEGAHDDGAGCVQALEVVSTFKALAIKPKRTLRCVWFMNEENGQAGAKIYAEWSNGLNERHIAAIESDRGGFTPRGFTTEADDSVYKEKLKLAKRWEPLLTPYGLTIGTGGSGADITRLKPQKGLLFGLNPDSQRYFDYHHARNDVFENVNRRELELGAAAMSALVYLIDRHGL